MTTTVYTDGACLGNPGPGGWAWAVLGGGWASGPEKLTTNQRMEIRAALEAVTAIAGPVEVVSDSTYVVNCFRDRWWENWLARGWKNSQKKDVANRDLWEPLIEAYRADPGRIRFSWVKGHSADAGNDLVDRLAVEAARTQVAAQGDSPPEVLPEPDVVGSPGAGAAAVGAAAADPRVPEGRRLVVAGHRPPELGGYEDNPIAQGVRRRLAEVLAAKQRMHPDLVVLTGLGLGAEQLAGRAALDAGVPFVAVLPFPGQEKVWPAPVQARHQALLAAARDVVLLQATPPDTKQKAGAAIARRDAWLARHADEAIVVWDEQEPFVGRTVRALRDHVGDEEVWVLSPEQATAP